MLTLVLQPGKASVQALKRLMPRRTKRHASCREGVRRARNSETDEAPCVEHRDGWSDGSDAPCEERRDGWSDGSDVEAWRRARNAETDEATEATRRARNAETDEATEATLRRRAVRGTLSRRRQCECRRRRCAAMRVPEEGVRRSPRTYGVVT